MKNKDYLCISYLKRFLILQTNKNCFPVEWGNEEELETLTHLNLISKYGISFS